MSEKMHAHTYFLPDQRHQIGELSHLILNLNFITFHQIYERAIGPHPLPMLEFHFSADRKAEVASVLAQHDGAFSTLLHFDTGDDVRDHVEGITWLGQPLPIDFDFFELIKQHPELKVHPD